MKFKKAFSFLAAAAVALAVSAVSASAEDILTSAKLKEYVMSGDGRSNVYDLGDTVIPSISGKVTLSKPFKLPSYDIEKNKVYLSENLWCSAVFSDGRLAALSTFSYQNEEVVMGAVLYVTDELAEKIQDGEKYSVFMVSANEKRDPDAEPVLGDNGNLTYAINAEGENIYLMRDSWTSTKHLKPYDMKTDEEDYKVLSEYNVISSDMEKAVTVKYDEKSVLENGGIIGIESAGTGKGYCKYNGSIKFAVKAQGRDESGRMMYTLAPEDKPNSTVKIGGSEKLYILCALGGAEPMYKICPAENPGKVLVYTTDKTKSGVNIKLKKWSGDDEQMWTIHHFE